MPELPEVETVRRGLAPAMEGAVIERLELRRGDLRFPFPLEFAASIAGQRIASLSRRAKYLLIDLDNGMTVVAHLGMSGSFRIEAGRRPLRPATFTTRAPRTRFTITSSSIWRAMAKPCVSSTTIHGVSGSWISLPGRRWLHTLFP